MLSFFKRSQEKQFVPTKDEVDNTEIKLLSKRLQSKDPKETLVNILEWQDRNLKFWDERWLTYGILMFILILSAITLFLYIQGINNSLAIFLLAGFIIIAIIGKNILNFIFNLILLFAFIIAYVLLLSSLIQTVSLPSKTFFFIIAISVISGAFISLIINLLMKYRNIKTAIPEFKIDDTFKISLPIEKILKYRLSICRDYAKLTSALLLNIYSDKEIFFALIPKHVAVAIKINDKLHVLDQRLPVSTLDKWAERWRNKQKKKKLTVELVRITKNKEGIKTDWIKQKYQFTDENQNQFKLDLKKISDELIKALGIIANNTNTKNCLEIDIPLKNCVALFEEDEIATFSLIEALKNKVEDEMAGNIKEVCVLSLVQKDKDLILKIGVNKNGIRSN